MKKMFFLLYAILFTLIPCKQMQAMEKNPLNFLVQSAFEGNLDEVKKYLPSVDDPNAYATLAVQFKTVTYNANALSAAALNKKNSIIKFLLNPQEVTTAVKEKTTNPFLLFNPFIIIIKKAIDVNEADTNLFGKSNYTPLFYAVLGENNEGVTLLLDKGANVNAVDSAGNTPLHLAASLNLLEIAKTLKNNGADLKKKNNEGKTAYDLTKEKNNEELKKLLKPVKPLPQLTEEEKLVKLITAVWQGKPIENLTNVDNINGYVQQEEIKIDINALDAAAWKGHLDIVKELIEKGANINSQNSIGLTVLMFIPLASKASYEEQDVDDNALFEIYKFVLSKSPNINLQNEDGETAIYAPLILPVEKGKKYLEELLKYKPDLTIKDSEGKTPLQVAEGLGDQGKEYVKILKEAEKSTHKESSDKDLLGTLSALTNTFNALSSKLR